jgi:enediyne biosynthesis protein E4
MSRNKTIVFLCALLAAAGVAYFVSKAFFKKTVDPVNPDGGTIETREKLPVPTVKFTDVTKDAGITFQHVMGSTGAKLLPETMGGGVAVFDYDGDGKLDILFTQSGELPGHAKKGPLPTMALYRNLGNWKFEDVTAAAGLNVPMFGMGVCIGDIDNDGRPDIFISCVGKHHMFRNVDGKKFEEISEAAGVAGGPQLPAVGRDEFLEWKEPIPFGSSCTFIDYDGDGRLDLFVCHYITWSPKIDRSVSATLGGLTRAYVPPKEFTGAQCSLYRNVDGKKFENVGKTAGIELYSDEGTAAGARKRSLGKALGVIQCDPDDDGWPDLMIANDGVPNFFFHNVADPKTGGRRYQECAYDCGAALAEGGAARGGMGIDFGEFMPGLYAAIIANFAKEANTFFRLRPRKPGEPVDLFFNDTALSYGLAGQSRTPLKFGAFFFDYDLDGRLDLLTNNGHIEPEIATVENKETHAQAAQLYWNTGSDKPVYELVGESPATKDLLKPLVGRGSAYADLDGDGDPDLVLAANGGTPIVLRNDNDLKHHSVRLKLTGNGQGTNRDAIGAKVVLQTGGKTLTRYLVGARGYLSQSESTITFGLGKSATFDAIAVTWPGKTGFTEVFANVPVDTLTELKQGSGKKVP